jgi:hypothetical protein
MKWVLMTQPIQRPLTGLGLAGLLAIANPATASESNHPSPSAEGATFIRPETTCPQELEPLVELLLRDLPAYTNRVSQRAASLLGTAPVGGERTLPYLLLAEIPDFGALSLGPGQYTPTNPNLEPPQVFFTTLERQYTSTDVRLFEQYHWMFLTQTESGWRFVMMFSRLADYPQGEPITPPRDTSFGAIAEATRQWLNDCRNGDIFPAD